jgi:hypothetical protein
MLKDRRSINKNVRGCRLQAGIIYGSNPRPATKWCDQPTAPPKFVNYRFDKCDNTLQGIGENNGISKQFKAFARYGWETPS